MNYLNGNVVDFGSALSSQDGGLEQIAFHQVQAFDFRGDKAIETAVNIQLSRGEIAEFEI